MKLNFVILIPFLFFLEICIGQEICDNGIDDDGNGLVDLNDVTQCSCQNDPPSLIPNPSFEDNLCCPTANSQLTCADQWVQASSATSDYFNLCGWNGILFGGFLHAPKPLPGGGSAWAGFFNRKGWKEYLGACLLNTMNAGQSYTIDFDLAFSGGEKDMEIVIYGTADCANLPMSTKECPLQAPGGGWMELGKQSLTLTAGSWDKGSITFTPPVDIRAITFGPNCADPAGGNNYYYIDNLILNPADGREVVISQNGNFCNNDVVLEAEIDTVGGSWQWFRNGVALVGETNDVLNVSANGYPAGVFTAQYVVGTACFQTDFDVIDNTGLSSHFTVNSNCQDNVSFSSTSTAGEPIKTYAWSFGDGNTSASENPTHVYAAPGNFDITLEITTDSGCKDIFDSTITVVPLPEVDFMVEDTCLGDFTQFRGNVISGIVTSWDWNFGDGNRANSQETAHRYNEAREYNVVLEVESDMGCQSIYRREITISPLPELDILDSEVCFGEENALEAVISNGVPILIANWDFGDGNTGNGLSTNHLYASSGRYELEISGFSTEGCPYTFSDSAFVNPLPEPDFVVDDNCLGLPVGFEDKSIAKGAPIVSYLYEFGSDGGDQISKEQNPTHTFQKAGKTDVTLTIVDANTCDSSVTKAVDVFPVPQADFYFTPNTLDELFNEVDLINTSNGVDTWEWTFNNLVVDDVNYDVISYLVEDTGYFNVKLMVKNEWDCVDSAEKSIYVKPNTSLFIPNSFTPDGDGVNDYFSIEGINISSKELYVYNRWGELVFSGNGDQAKWDGMFDGNPCKMDVYIWKASIEFVTDVGTVKEYIGHISLIK